MSGTAAKAIRDAETVVAALGKSGKGEAAAAPPGRGAKRARPMNAAAIEALAALSSAVSAAPSAAGVPSSVTQILSPVVSCPNCDAAFTRGDSTFSEVRAHLVACNPAFFSRNGEDEVAAERCWTAGAAIIRTQQLQIVAIQNSLEQLRRATFEGQGPAAGGSGARPAAAGAAATAATAAAAAPAKRRKTAGAEQPATLPRLPPLPTVPAPTKPADGAAGGSDTEDD